MRLISKTITVRLAGVALISSVLACATTQAPQPPTSIGARAAGAAAPSGSGQGAGPATGLGSLLRHVPANAGAVVLVEEGVFSMYRSWLRTRPEMKKELSRYLVAHLGEDLTEVGGIVGWAVSLGDSPVVAALVELKAPGRLKGKIAGQHRGVDLLELGDKMLAARVAAGLVLGSRDGVTLAIDLAQGNVRPMSEGGLGFACQLDVGRADLFAAADLQRLPLPSDVSRMAAQFDLRAVAFSLGLRERASLAIAGSPDRLKVVKSLLMAGAGTAVGALEKKMKDALQGDQIGEAIGTTIGFHEAKRLLAELEPRQAGDVLVSEYRLPTLDAMNQGAVYVSVAGILSAVAIPAFIKYIRKSKAAEASINLTRIAEGAKAYHHERYRKGRAFKFPASTEWTPAGACCSAAGAKCAAAAAAFAGPTWRALRFQLDDPHHYQYRFLSSGAGPKASFSVEAQGDLDCDGVFSSYRIEGRVDAKGELHLDEPVIVNELE